MVIHFILFHTELKALLITLESNTIFQDSEWMVETIVRR